LYADIVRVARRNSRTIGKLAAVTFNPPLWAISCYRLGHFLWGGGVFMVPRLLSVAGRIISGVEIAPSAEIGPGLLIVHGSGVIIEADVQIGRGVTLYQGVGVGRRFSSTRPDGAPTIGNDVTIYAGAKVLGPVKIGNRCCIGANAVVTRSFSDDKTIAGVPARAIGEYIPPATTVADGTLVRVAAGRRQPRTAQAYSSSTTPDTE